MNKQLGQNFLISPHVRRSILDELELDSSMQVWEIGPGIGAMTHGALKSGASMVLFELDYGFCSLLRDLYPEENAYELVEGDVLKTWRQAADRLPMPDRIFGNLPYNAGSVFIARVIEHQFLPQRMVYTLQREVAQRLTAETGTKKYSSFTMLCALDYQVTICAHIAAEHFYPAPEVVSSIVRFDKKHAPGLTGEERRVYLALVRELFASRRKTLRNNLKQGSLKHSYDLQQMLQVFSSLGIPESRRAETISPDEMMKAAGGIVQTSG